MLRKTTISSNIKREPLNIQPVIIRVTEFNDNALRHFNEAFQQAVDSDQEVVPIWIDTYGGQVYTVLAMLETIRCSPIKVATYVSSKAMSCGAVLLSAGNEGLRFIAPGAHVLVHQVSGGAWGEIRGHRCERNSYSSVKQTAADFDVKELW